MHDIKCKFNDDIDFSLVTVEKLLTNIKDTKSCGPDGLSSFLLQKLKSNISLPLSIIFNQSYKYGVIPDMWRQAVVCPVYKGSGSKMNVDNYRPKSLTCVCYKLMESILTKSILVHICKIITF